jgi:hypothetical protein
MPEHYIAFWNLENLFDVDRSPGRPEWLQRQLRSELAGWDEAVLGRKISQLASIIGQMNGGLGPDVLGVCELENRSVVTRLANTLASRGRQYAVAHHDTSDQRGIDVAFLYDPDRFTAEETFSHVILKRTATRDIFQVNLHGTNGKDLIVVGNHWPARSGGVFESEPYRMTAGETLSYWMERILEIKGSNAAVLVMGDFNDQPYDRSIQEYAQATYLTQRVVGARLPRLLNLMWPFYGQGLGTYYFDNFPLIFDQFLASRGLLNGGGGFHVRPESTEILMFPEMRATGTYPVPRRFSRPSESGFNPDGYSDHYPIGVRVSEV